MSKSISLSLVLAASLGLAACSGGDKGANNTVENVATENASNAAENALNAAENATNAAGNATNAAANVTNASNAM